MPQCRLLPRDRQGGASRVVTPQPVTRPAPRSTSKSWQRAIAIGRHPSVLWRTRRGRLTLPIYDRGIGRSTPVVGPARTPPCGRNAARQVSCSMPARPWCVPRGHAPVLKPSSVGPSSCRFETAGSPSCISTYRSTTAIGGQPCTRPIACWSPVENAGSGRSEPCIIALRSSPAGSRRWVRSMRPGSPIPPRSPMRLPTDSETSTAVPPSRWWNARPDRGLKRYEVDLSRPSRWFHLRSWNPVSLRLPVSIRTQMPSSSTR